MYSLIVGSGHSVELWASLYPRDQRERERERERGRGREGEISLLSAEASTQQAKGARMALSASDGIVSNILSLLTARAFCSLFLCFFLF